MEFENQWCHVGSNFEHTVDWWVSYQLRHKQFTRFFGKNHISYIYPSTTDTTIIIIFFIIIVIIVIVIIIIIIITNLEKVLGLFCLHAILFLFRFPAENT